MCREKKERKFIGDMLAMKNKKISLIGFFVGMLGAALIVVIVKMIDNPLAIIDVDNNDNIRIKRNANQQELEKLRLSDDLEGFVPMILVFADSNMFLKCADGLALIGDNGFPKNYYLNNIEVSFDSVLLAFNRTWLFLPQNRLYSMEN